MTPPKLLTTADAREWDASLPAAQSAFGSHAFALVRERAGGPRPLLLTASHGDSRVAYPLGLRDLADLPIRPPPGPGRADAVSPPFTGPYLLAGGEEGELDVIGLQIAELFAAEGIVSEFAHLHPWRARPRLAGGGAIDREVVWMDLSLDAERAWSESYSKACRKNVRRSEREGVTVRPAETAADVAAFHRIYTATMERNEALGSYFFGEDYFQAIFEEMPASSRFALAEREGTVIAATLYLHDGDDVYSYLGGADHDHQQVRPTNAVVHATAAWARNEGKKRLILGGGYRPDDGIFRFKASFSPLRKPLELARRVHLPGEYERLVLAWRAHGGADSGFFPAYRQPLGQDAT